jgi:hypothetical protein
VAAAGAGAGAGTPPWADNGEESEKAAGEVVLGFAPAVAVGSGESTMTWGCSAEPVWPTSMVWWGGGGEHDVRCFFANASRCISPPYLQQQDADGDADGDADDDGGVGFCSESR